MFGIMLLVSYLLINSTRSFWLTEMNERTREYATGQSSLFEQRLNRVFSNAFILGSLVQQGQGYIEHFEKLAPALLHAMNERSVLQLAPRGIIERIYPLVGQEGAIGHNILRDDLRLKEAELAKSSEMMTLAGPFDLKQGGVGIIARQPVYLYENSINTTVDNSTKRFWGFASVMIYMQDALKMLDIEGLGDAGFDYQLSRIHPDSGEPQVFSSSVAEFVQPPIRQFISLPNAVWYLDIAKKTGGISYQWVIFFTFICIAISALISHWLYTFLHRGQELRRLIRKRTAQLQQTNLNLQNEQLELVKLSNAVEQSGNAVIISNAQGIIDYVNPRFSEVTGYQAEEVIGHKTSILRSQVTTLEEHQQLWQTITSGSSWYGERRNKQKNGNLYWSKMSISPVKDANGVITHFVSVSEDITNEKEAYLSIQHLAFHDPLTGLPNRRYFVDRLSHLIKMSKREQEPTALMFIDLDYFKAINDELGHEVGDLFLIEIARRLKETIRETDTIARIGGDEFTVLLPKISQPIDVENIAKKLLSNVNKPMTINEHTLNASVSIGITLISPNESLGANQLIRRADIALYEAKEAGRNTYRFLQENPHDVSDKVTGSMRGQT
jgi:diguanylate cyclase (GGDEF)-like protein/PAS domain S-box-containing protein